jgi:hypothetical protein
MRHGHDQDAKAHPLMLQDAGSPVLPGVLLRGSEPQPLHQDHSQAQARPLLESLPKYLK